MLPLEKWDIDNSDTIEIQNNIQLEKKDIKDLFEEKSISLPRYIYPSNRACQSINSALC